MTESIRYLCENVPLPVSVLPNAGLPSVVDGKMHYDETPETFTNQVIHFANDFGVNVVGGCCGTTPAHLKLVVDAMQRITAKARDVKLVPAASSIYFQQPYVQDASFLIVGERVNASGSKKMRDLLNAENWDGLVALAKEQEREGAHILDVNVDFVGRNGEKDMHELASRLVTNIKLPLMFDSTEWEKMEAGLQHAGGKSILNSTNYEDGVPRFSKVLALAKTYGASVVIGTIDEAGLDAAIVNASKIEPLNRIGEQELKVAHDLIYDRREFEGDVCIYDPLTAFTTLFENVKAKTSKKESKGATVEERLKNHIIDGEKIGLEDELTKALETHPALDIINNILLDGMKVVGDLFGSGQMQLPFVLQSAEAMKAAVRFLEPFMEKKGGATAKGTLVLATVKGDVHDIGKNLVDIILTNNGYKVINLGIKQPIDNILQAQDEHKADAIGMSGLLVKSTLIMKDNLELMNERGIKAPVILGGAALTRRYVNEDLKSLYKGSLFYAGDAFAGLHTMDKLMDGNGENVITDELARAAAAVGGEGEVKEDVEDLVGEEAKLGIRKPLKPRGATKVSGDTTHTTKSAVQPVVSIPRAPFYGSRV